MFNITLMLNKSPKNFLNKDVTVISQLVGTMRGETDIINPVFDIEMENVPTNVNYIQVPGLTRYYFVDNIICVRTGLWRFECSTDPLMSFSGQIKQCEGIIRRAQSGRAYNVMLDDGSFRAYNNPFVVTKEFPQGFNTRQYVLAVAGGTSSTSASSSDNGNVEEG